MLPVPEIIYRLADGADLPAVGGMYEKLDRYFRSLSYRFPEVENVGQLWLDSFRRTLGRFSVLHVAQRQDILLGFVLGRVKRVAPYLGGVLVGELSDIWVEPEARRLGTGERLAQLDFEWLKAQGVHSIEVQILEGNLASQAFFRSLGLKPELSLYRLTWEDRNEQRIGGR
jgi:ribosomal protein S18 acetylase RimI-like enzyme